jgi:hypothetical protein
MWEETMQRNVVRTTLGELIVALTDEVMPRTEDPAGPYKEVAEILRTLMERRRVRLSHPSKRRRYALSN